MMMMMIKMDRSSNGELFTGNYFSSFFQVWVLGLLSRERDVRKADQYVLMDKKRKVKLCGTAVVAIKQFDLISALV